MTYYVVAQIVGLVDIDILYQFVIDFMLELMLFSIYLLYILFICYLHYLLNNIDGIKYYLQYLNMYSQNNILLIIFYYKYINIKSADNLTLYFKDHFYKWLGVSETKRQLFILLTYLIIILNILIKYINIFINNLLFINTDISILKLKTIINIQEVNDNKFWEYLAGVIDGGGNFDLRILNNKLTLKSIKIKLHNRDLRILTYIQNTLHMGRIRKFNNKLYSIYVISTLLEMTYIINNINGLIRLKNESFLKTCNYLQIELIKLNYIILKLSLYLSGLIDTHGSIIFNFTSNRIECALEVKYKNNLLNLDYVILNCKLSVSFRNKNIKNNNYITFKYQNVNSMMQIYDYFMINRLYSDMKFYRVSKIKYFLDIRKYNKCLKNSIEYHVYKSFILDFIKYENLLWYKVLFVSKL